MAGEIITPAGEAADAGEPSHRLLEWGLVAAALLGRLPALGAWWNLDDWGQLGRAARLLPAAAGEFPARVLSQHWWWTWTWPIFGLAPQPQALARMLVHGLCAVLVARIGRRAGLHPTAWFVAGLLFVATPLAFTPLYWASGIQELAAAVFALWAVERWLAGGRRNLALALAGTVLSLLAKESGLGLPLFFLALLWLHDGVALNDKAFAWALTVFMLLAAVLEGALVAAHFATGPGEPYAMGGADTVISNLGSFGWWLLSPAPLPASRLTWAMGACGAAFFLLWGLWALLAARSGRRLPAAGLWAALLVLGPALPLRTQINPYLAYLAVAPLALTLAGMLPARPAPRLPLAGGLLLAAAVWSFAGMRVHLDARNELGMPADPVVRATSLSWQAARTVRALAESSRPGEPDSAAAVVVFQVPVSASDAEAAERFGPRWVRRSETYLALGGEAGLTLVAGEPVQWVNALTEAPPRAQVAAETAAGLKVWGPLPNALLYAALTDVGLGHYERARRHLLRAGSLQGATMNFAYDEDQMIVPVQMALRNLQPFVDWTVAQLQQGRSRMEVGGLQTMFFSLLSTASGKSVQELTAGSSVLIPGER